MAKRRSYGDPPVIEALCQFQFEAGQEWDIAIPGLVYQRVQDEFPKRRQQKGFEVLFSPDTSKVKPLSSDRIQFLRADDSALVQLGPDLLAVNVLPPYPGWDSFKRLILGALESYSEVARPANLKSMALRYINRVRVPALRFEIDDYLRFSPRVPSELPQTFVGWGQNVSIPLGASEVLRITAGSEDAEAKATHLSFLLDIEVVALGGGLRGVPDSIERAHEMIGTAFEKCITEKSRALFKEEVSHEHAVHS